MTRKSLIYQSDSIVKFAFYYYSCQLSVSLCIICDILPGLYRRMGSREGSLAYLCHLPEEPCCLQQKLSSGLKSSREGSSEEVGEDRLLVG